MNDVPPTHDRVVFVVALFDTENTRFSCFPLIFTIILLSPHYFSLLSIIAVEITS